jgi:hypothetical protein
MDNNKFAMAAKIWKEMSAIHEKEHNTAEAIKTDEKATNWSANKRSGNIATASTVIRRVCSLLLLSSASVSSVSYDPDNRTSNANALWIKVDDIVRGCGGL